VIVPDPNFRPNPERAIHVQGLIDQQLIDRLAPRILLLTHKSRAPITVFIDSRGGLVVSAEIILRLLKATNQDGANPCHIVTVAISRASSAAADLLSSGDYAIAYPDSTLLYHGVRTSMTDPVTAELATELTETLKISNDRYAMSLARKSEWRFLFRVFALRGDFDKHRTAAANPGLTDLQCFTAIIRQNLSGKAAKVLDQAVERWERYNGLLTHFHKMAMKRRAVSSQNASIQVEKIMLRSIIDFEVQRNRANPTWSFRDGGLFRVNDDFFLLNEYFQSAYSDQFKQICERWAMFLLTEADQAELEKLSEPEKSAKKLEKVRPYFLPFWSFFVALCHALQEGDNELTPTDAFWLGLIDEVIGHPDLPLTRYFAEHQEDPKPAIESSEVSLPSPSDSGTPLLTAK